MNHNLIEGVELGAAAHFKVDGKWNDDLMSQITAPHPSAMASGRFLRGSFTSPAMIVMSCQESAENNDPDCDTQMAANNPNAVAAFTDEVMGLKL